MQTDAVLAMLQEVAESIVTPRFRALDSHEVMEKKPGDLVTVADREAEVELTARLQAAYPDALIVGEEAVAADPAILQRIAGAGQWFTIDPIDGTRNFVHGSPDHALMIAEMRGADVQRAIIWQPEYQVAYTAERDAGAWRNGERIGSPARDADAPRGHTSRRNLLGARIGGLPPMELSWVCCGVDYPHIALGDADYLLYGGSMPWDHAPGSLLLREAGGVVGYADGAPYDPTSLQTPIIAAGDSATYQAVLHALAEDAAANA